MRFIYLSITLAVVLILSLSPFKAVTSLAQPVITPTKTTDYQSEVIPMQVIVDRFEGDIAVLELPNRTTKDVSRKLLPPEAKEGDVLQEKDGKYILLEAETKARAGEIEDLMKEVWGD